MRFILLVLCAVLFLGGRKSVGQEVSGQHGFYLGIHASTNGYGANARYAFSDKFSLRTGYETLKFSYDFDFDEQNVQYDATFDFETGGILLLADYT